MQSATTFPPASWQENWKSYCIRLPAGFSYVVLSSATSIHAHVQRVHTTANLHLP